MFVKAFIVSVNKCLKSFFLGQCIDSVNTVMLQSFLFYCTNEQRSLDYGDRRQQTLLIRNVFCFYFSRNIEEAMHGDYLLNNKTAVCLPPHITAIQAAPLSQKILKVS